MAGPHSGSVTATGGTCSTSSTRCVGCSTAISRRITVVPGNHASPVGVSNSGYWRHSIGKYLGQPALRSIVSEIFD